MAETDLQMAREQEGQLHQEAAEARAKAQVEAATHEEAARITAEMLMQEHLEHDAIAAEARLKEDHIRQEREAGEGQAKAQAEAAAREDAARAVAAKLIQEQQECEAVYCGKNVITSRISSSDKYQWVILVVQWGDCSPIVEGIMKVLAPSGLSR